ncbi:MAG: 5-formyltetrahydrofolate cyclo-ligase [Cellvibrionales bacterium]
MSANTKRCRLRATRRALTTAQQRVAAENVAERLAQQAFFQSATRVATYWQSDGEVDPKPLQKRFSDVKQWFLPRLTADNSTAMMFAEICGGTPLVTNRFGIPEPAIASTRSEHAASMELILLPLVGFDRSGNRLGMGGGYYDRMLANVPTVESGGPLLVGLAHSCQECRQMSPQTWDIKLNMIITDGELICARPK